MYEGAEATVQANGELVDNVPIHCGVRQGFPMSTTMFALCIHPLLLTLHNTLPKIRIGGSSLHSPVVAYAVDVIVFVTRPGDFDVVKDAITTYERASGARMKPVKSRALPVGSWSHPPSIFGMGLQARVRILGLDFTTSTQRSAAENWDNVINSVRAQATKAYNRQLVFAQRILFVQMYLLAKIWYVAQVFPATRKHAQRLTTVCMWYLWQGPETRPHATSTTCSPSLVSARVSA
jgi:hypothetical protein